MGHDPHRTIDFWRSRAGMTLCAALLAGGFYLLVEHTVHTFGVQPYLLVLACPLMHLFMHHDHHGGHSHAPPPRRTQDDQQQ